MSFEIGDKVMRRWGTLGNMYGEGEVGTVRAIGLKADHPCLTVEFLSHTETFAEDIYIRVNNMRGVVRANS